MKERLWLKISHLRLFNWQLFDPCGGNEPLIYCTLGLGDFQVRGVTFTPSADGKRLGGQNFAAASCRMPVWPAAYKLEDQPIPDRILEGELAQGLAEHFRQAQCWSPMQRFLEGGPAPYEIITAPLHWRTQSLWVPVDYVELFNFKVARDGLHADIKLGDHLLFWEQLIDGEHMRLPEELYPNPDDRERRDEYRYRRDPMSLRYEHARRDILGWRVWDVLEAALEQAWHNGLDEEVTWLKSQRRPNTAGREPYRFGKPLPDATIPDVVLSEHEPPALVMAA